MGLYFLGVDVGGTKSQAIIADDSGHVLGVGEAGPGNHESVGYDGLIAVLHTITGQALSMSGISMAQIAGAGFGIAGYDWPSERQPTLDAIASLGLHVPVEAVNDTIVGLLAGASQGWGVVVIAGTSNNCRGRDQHGREGRIVGHSWFGEYGGSGELMVKAIQAVAHSWTRRGPPTRLAQAFIEQCGARDIPDLLEGLTQEYYHLGASSARLVFKVAQEGDASAIQVIAWAGQELGWSAVGVIRQLEFENSEFEVVMAGSLFNGGSLLIEPMRQTIHKVAPGARLVRLEAPPVVGGVVLGMQQASFDPADIRLTLIRSIQEYYPKRN